MKLKSGALIVLKISVPLAVVAYLLYKAWSDGLDFRVYWAGASAFVQGGDLYAPGLPGTGNGGMAFTYAPFSAALFAPMAFLPMKAAMMIHALSSIAIAGLLGALMVQFFSARNVLQIQPTRRAYVLASAFAGGLILFTGPWRETLALGQINPMLLGLIALDLLFATRKHPNGLLPRGILTGLAAAIKLTPMVFMLYFVVKGDFKSATRMLGTFVATVAVMWAILPELSARYWLGALGNTDRVGHLDVYENISIRGFVARLELNESLEVALWATLCLLTVALGALAIRRMNAINDNWSAVSATAIVMLLISPVSWNHHWVWVVIIVSAVVGRHASVRGDFLGWGEFLKSVPGLLAAWTLAGFMLGASLAVRLTGSRPFESVSTFSEIVAQLGMFGAAGVLVWFALGRQAVDGAAGAHAPAARSQLTRRP